MGHDRYKRISIFLECVHEITYVFRLEEFSAKVDMTVPRVSRLQEYESTSVHRI